MNRQKLIETARTLLAGDKGPPSNPTGNKRFALWGFPHGPVMRERKPAA